MFFTQLQSTLAASHKSVALTVTFRDDGQMIILVKPELKEGKKVEFQQQAAPFVLSATPQELDAHFIEAFAQQVQTTQSLADQAKQQREEAEAAAKAAAEAAKSTTKTRSAASAKAAAPTGSSALDEALSGGKDLDEDEDGHDNDHDEPAKADATAATPAAKPAAEKAEPITAAEDLFSFGL